MIKKNVLLVFLLLSCSILLVSTPLFAEESTGFKPAKYKQSVYFFTNSLTDYSDITLASGSKFWWGLDLRVNLTLNVRASDDKDTHFPIGDEAWETYKNEGKHWYENYGLSMIFIKSLMQKDRFEVYGGFGPLFTRGGTADEILTTNNGEIEVERWEYDYTRWGVELMGGIRWWVSPRVAIVTEYYMQDYYEISKTREKQKDINTNYEFFTWFEKETKQNSFDFKNLRLGISLYL